MKLTDRLFKIFILAMIGGNIYFFIEVIYKTITNNSGIIHWSMNILGMVVFVLIGSINENILRRGMPLWKQCAISTIIILVCEFITGFIVNTCLGLNVWYYESFHIMHNVCLGFSFIWYFLSLFGIWLDDKLREKLFDEEKHIYRFF